MQVKNAKALFKHCLLLITGVHLVMIVPSIIYDQLVFWPHIEQLEQHDESYGLIYFVSPTNIIYSTHFIINIAVIPLLLAGLAIGHFRKEKGFTFGRYTASMLGAVFLGTTAWCIIWLIGTHMEVVPSRGVVVFMLLQLGVQGLAVLLATTILFFRCR